MVRVHRGLDDETWDIETIFEEHFPNLQRRSALITLYSFLEHELNRLCNLFIENESLKIALADIYGKGIQRAFLFLEKVVGLHINNTTTVWSEVKNIQSLRNCIVHQNGQLRSGKDDLRSYVMQSRFLSGENEIKILEGYLDHVLNTFDLQFQEMDRSIAATERR